MRETQRFLVSGDAGDWVQLRRLVIFNLIYELFSIIISRIIDERINDVDEEQVRIR